MSTKTRIEPDARLKSAEPYFTKGCRIADIGTDHAYLPIYLVQNGIASYALACDVNQGPLDRASANIRQAGLEDKIETLRTDGLHGVEPYAPDFILIFGMGGDLIIRILSEAPWLQNTRVRLILQPMTRAASLRRWLLEHGFSITGESLSFSEKYYQTIVACPDPQAVFDYTEEELLLGRYNIAEDPPLFRGFLMHEKAVLERIVQGKKRSACGADGTSETALLDQLRKRLEEST